jgi:GAF domain-containing protein
LADRISVVQRIAERLTDVVDRADLCRAVTAELRSGLGVSALVMVAVGPDGSELTPLVVEGVSSETRSRLTDLHPRRSWVAAMHSVGEGKPLFWSSIDDRDRELPAFAGQQSLARSWAILPLVVRGALIGSLAIGWPDERPFTEVESSILEMFAHQCAVALDRTRLEQTRRAERAVLELLSEGTRVMVSALDPPSVIDSLVHLAVPRLAPWCGVYVAEDGVLRRVAIEIVGDRLVAAELRGERAVSLDDGHHPLSVAFRTGETQVVAISEAMVRAVYTPKPSEEIFLPGEQWTALAVPIKASGQVIGVMSLVSNNWGTSPPDDVRFAADGLAARAGVALMNAHRFEHERATSALLVEAVLPRRLPDVPGYALAARYLPAGARVAGDWFDAAALPSGEYLIGIGDVGGHGVEAAATMGQLRNCARGFAVIGHSPAAILEALRMVTMDGDDCFATAAYAVLDPDRHWLRWSTAGHLPPLRFRDGVADYLEQTPAPPLGCTGRRSIEHRFTLGTGDGFVLVTDGVVENRRRGLDEGMELLRDLVEQNATVGADKLVELITEHLCREPEDDCCIVVLERD